MAEGVDNSRNEVEIDLDKYMALIEKLDKSEDTIKEMKAEAEAARKQLAPPKRKFICLLYTSPSPRDRQKSRMPSSA